MFCFVGLGCFLVVLLCCFDLICERFALLDSVVACSAVSVNSVAIWYAVVIIFAFLILLICFELFDAILLFAGVGSLSLVFYVGGL